MGYKKLAKLIKEADIKHTILMKLKTADLQLYSEIMLELERAEDKGFYTFQSSV
jgi:hypothetical protein